MPVYSKLPSFLAEMKYRNPTDITKSAWQPGHNTTETPFPWLMSRLPSEIKYVML